MRGETFNCSASSFSTLFQSTPLMRGETAQPCRRRAWMEISIHSPHARGDNSCHLGHAVFQISIHSPHARGDRFLSRLIEKMTRISIHSPHARGDYSTTSSSLSSDYFNPLPSCEGRQCWDRCTKNPLPFQSTPLMRGETDYIVTGVQHSEISIHSPHARGDEARKALTIQKMMISIHSPHARGDNLEILY